MRIKSVSLEILTKLISIVSMRNFRPAFKRFLLRLHVKHTSLVPHDAFPENIQSACEQEKIVNLIDRKQDEGYHYTGILMQ